MIGIMKQSKYLCDEARGKSKGCVRPNFINTYPWFRSTWFRVTLFSFVLLSLMTGILTEAPAVYLVGQIFLGSSVWFSLKLLANYPLVNPVQAVVPIFYWWFGVAPTVIASFKAIIGLADDALYAQTSGMEGIWIVVLGLPVYAFAARRVLSWFSKKAFYAQFLFPTGQNYRLKTIIILFVCGFGAQLVISALVWIGVSGITEINYLGGTITTIWWIGAIAGVAAILLLAKSAVLSELVRSGRNTSKVMKILALIVLIESLVMAMTSGWKGPFVLAGFFILCAYISKTQRIPFTWLVIGMCLYLFVIEPFVSLGRHVAETMNVTTSTSKAREAVFNDLISEGRLFNSKSWKDINIESPFRSIYPIASELTRRNGWFDGEWHGYTITLGLSALIPRALYPDKPGMNVGNFFARSVGADIGISSYTDTETNIGMSIPFEVVGNFGWIAGILSFGLIGIIWASFSAWILTAQRLSNHPLTPWVISLAFGLEAPIGHFLANIRGMLIPLCVSWVIWKLLHKKV